MRLYLFVVSQIEITQFTHSMHKGLQNISVDKVFIFLNKILNRNV